MRERIWIIKLYILVAEAYLKGSDVLCLNISIAKERFTLYQNVGIIIKTQAS